MDIPTPSLTRSEKLNQEISSLHAEFKREEEAEALAKTRHHWIKKRLKLANDELIELNEKPAT